MAERWDATAAMEEFRKTHPVVHVQMFGSTKIIWYCAPNAWTTKQERKQEEALVESEAPENDALGGSEHAAAAQSPTAASQQLDGAVTERGAEVHMLREEVERLKTSLEDREQRCEELEPLKMKLQHSQEKAHLQELKERHVADRQPGEDRSQAEIEDQAAFVAVRSSELDLQVDEETREQKRLAAEEAARLEEARRVQEAAEKERIAAEEAARLEEECLAAEEAARLEEARIAQEETTEQECLAAEEAARLEVRRSQEAVGRLDIGELREVDEEAKSQESSNGVSNVEANQMQAEVEQAVHLEMFAEPPLSQVDTVEEPFWRWLARQCCCCRK